MVPEAWDGAEGRVDVVFLLEVGIDGLTDYLGHRYVLTSCPLSEAGTLVVRQINLRAGCHIHHGVYITSVRSDSALRQTLGLYRVSLPRRGCSEAVTAKGPIGVAWLVAWDLRPCHVTIRRTIMVNDIRISGDATTLRMSSVPVVCARGGVTVGPVTPTWKPYERHGRLTTQSDLPATVFAFPTQRKEPMTDAKHVRDAVARFDQVTDVSDADRDLAFANIEMAAQHYGVKLSETNWHQLGVHPQPHRQESARKGAATRVRTGEAEEAARKGAETKERLGIAKKAAKKAAATRRQRKES